MTTERHLVIGILAHVDAGKTSLTERLLYEAGVIKEAGSVDNGTTRTDSMDVERRRGITVRSAVTSFGTPDGEVSIVDTPGHPDFIADVERALDVLDGAILVLSSVEGVQPQTVVVWRALQRMHIPTMLFINKLDRGGADPDRVLVNVQQRLTPSIVVLSRPVDPGGPSAGSVRLELDESSVVESLADVCPATLEDWAEGRTPSSDVLRTRLRGLLAAAAITPVLHGSALTGAGVAALRDTAVSLFPRSTVRPTMPAAGLVFKIDRDDAGRRTFVRLRAGTVSVRKELVIPGRPPQRITGLQVPRNGELVNCEHAFGGDIAVLRGLESAQIGDVFGDTTTRAFSFAPPTLEAVIEPLHSKDKVTMYSALTDLAEQDPLIDPRTVSETHEIAVKLFGEVQKEVIASLLKEWYDVEVRFRETTVVCLERVVGEGHHVECLRVGDNPYLATIGLRVQPGAIGSGVTFDLDVERGSLPSAFFTATEEGVRTAFAQGLSGWEVTDCRVIMTDSGYLARQSRPHQKFNKAVTSVATDFRNLGQLVAMSALKSAGTVVCEPVHRFDLEVPQSATSAVLACVGQLGGQIIDTVPQHDRSRFIGLLQAVQVRDLAAKLPGVAHGEAVLTSELDHHTPVLTKVPVRTRVGPDPGDRERWFREMPR